MKLEAYRETMKRLPITNATREDMEALCPHLTKEEVTAAFSGEYPRVACPPLRVRGAYRIVTFNRNVEVRGKKFGDVLFDSGAGRTAASYADQTNLGYVDHPVPYMSEAMKFAEDNWGDQLILDNWIYTEQIILKDCAKLIEVGDRKGQPVCTGSLTICSNRSYNDINNDHRKPPSVLADEAIVEMAYGDYMHKELKGGRPGGWCYNCGNCGSGLNGGRCRICGDRFKTDESWCGSLMPLSKKMAEFLTANGHEFKKDLALAWKEETELLTAWHGA